MPTYRKVAVHVTDANDQPLKEWGVRKRDRMKLSTCYIQSETDKAFRILIRPKALLFPWATDVAGELSDESEEEGEDVGLGGNSMQGKSLTQVDEAGGEGTNGGSGEDGDEDGDHSGDGYEDGYEDGYGYEDKDEGSVAKLPPQYDGAYEDDYEDGYGYGDKDERSVAKLPPQYDGAYDDWMWDDEETGAGSYEDDLERKDLERKTRAQDRAYQEAWDLEQERMRSFDVKKHVKLNLKGIASSASRAVPPQTPSLRREDPYERDVRPAVGAYTGSSWPPGNPYVRSAEGDGDSPTRSPTPPRRHHPPPPPAPWHLLATLRLDGRKTHEKRMMIFLDRRDPSFPKPDGNVSMAFRRVKDKKGDIRACGWYFQDVGIDAMFDQLGLSAGNNDEQAVPANDEEELLAAFGGLGANRFEDAEEKSAVGLIEVTLERATVLSVQRRLWKPEKQNNDTEIGSGDLTKVSHTVARDAGKKYKKYVDVTRYELVDPNERPYATFKFYYRSEDNLRKFGFAGFPSKAGVSVTGSSICQRKDALSKAAAAPLTNMNPNPERTIIDAVASPGKLHPQTAVRDDDEDDGVSPDKHDEGLSEEMKKLEIGSKRPNDDADAEVGKEIKGMEEIGGAEMAGSGKRQRMEEEEEEEEEL